MLQVDDVSMEIVEGDPRNVLCDAVDRHHAAILVVGSHGYGVVKRYDSSIYTNSILVDIGFTTLHPIVMSLHVFTAANPSWWLVARSSRIAG